MSIDLAGVVITTGMIWADQYAYSPVAQLTRRTLGGVQVVTYGVLSEGTPITLSSQPDQGWLLKTQVDALKVLADVAGAVYPLTIGSDTFQVMFRHEEPPALEFGPLIPRTIILDDDWMVGTIKLMTA